MHRTHDFLTSSADEEHTSSRLAISIMSSRCREYWADDRGTSTIQYAFLAAGLAASTLALLHFSGVNGELRRDASRAVPEISKLMPAE